MGGETVLVAVERWFSDALTASMELPDGWFGRPHDNMHRLTWIVERDGKVFLELDNILHVLLSDPVVENESPGELSLRCSQIVFDWREYGSKGLRHAVAYQSGGCVTLHASAVP